MSASEHAAVSVVIPVYNSAGTLPALVPALTAELQKLEVTYEIVLVNDGSKDNSWAVLSTLAQKHRNIHAINLMRNYGQHNALLCGIRTAKYPVIVTMDDDLQNPVGEIERLLGKLNEGYDVVYGSPQKEQHGIFRDLASRITKLVLQNAMGADTAGSISAFRAFRTELREAFAQYSSPFVNIDVLLTWGTTKFTAIKVKHDRRAQGQSSYTITKLITHALIMLTGFSTLPLQLASMYGFACVALGFVLIIYVIARYLLQGAAVPGFPFLASVIIIFSGAQLLALGIIGEYIARIHSITIERPPYVAKSEAQSPAKMLAETLN